MNIFDIFTHLYHFKKPMKYNKNTRQHKSLFFFIKSKQSLERWSAVMYTLNSDIYQAEGEFRKTAC